MLAILLLTLCSPHNGEIAATGSQIELVRDVVIRAGSRVTVVEVSDHVVVAFHHKSRSKSGMLRAGTILVMEDYGITDDGDRYFWLRTPGGFRLQTLTLFTKDLELREVHLTGYTIAFTPPLKRVQWHQLSPLFKVRKAVPPNYETIE